MVDFLNYCDIKERDINMATLEQRPTYPPFTVEFRLQGKGSNPYLASLEPKTLPPYNSVNFKAVLFEVIHLYDGPIQPLKVGRRIRSMQGFMKIQTGMYADGDQVYSTFFEGGLRDTNTGDEFMVGISADPIHVFRMVKTLESMPHLRTWHDRYINHEDKAKVYRAAQRVFHGFHTGFVQLKGSRDQFLTARREVAVLIGRARLGEILQMVPDNLEEIVQTIRQKGLWVDTDNLERELRVNRVHPSEFYLDTIRESQGEIKELARGMEECGWGL